jgi:DNA-binding CsgD family transcriptional regulator
MESLTQRDLESSLAFLRDIYGHLDLENFAGYVVSALPGLVSCDMISYSELDPARRTASWIIDPVPPDFPELLRSFEQNLRERPQVHPHGRTRGGELLKVSDFLERSRFQQLLLYEEICHRIGAEYRTTIEPPTPLPLVIRVSLDRGGRDFSGRERALLDTLGPHLAQAHRNAGAVTEMRRYLRSTRQAIEELDRGIIVLTAGGRVQWRTERARRLVAEYFGPLRGAEHLPEALRSWAERQRSLLPEAGGAPALHEPLTVERLGRRLVVRFVVDRRESRHLLLLEEQVTPFSPEALKTLGLTRREAEILVWIARGKTNQEIAAGLYISLLTVKKHLEHIYHKLGVEIRTEALSRALEIFGLL